MGSINTFRDLIVWKTAHQLVLLIYNLTKQFPKEELFGLTNQIRRAVVSITSNIAEGFSRKSTKEKRQFYYLSLGSLTEVENQIIIARDLKYITTQQYAQTMDLIVQTGKLLNGLIRSLKVSR